MNTHELPARIDQALAAGFSDAGQTQSLNDLSNAVTHFIRTGNLPDA